MRKVGLLTRAMDYVLKPQIVDFAWKKALKSSQADVLVGAKQAAAVVSDSLIAAVGGDDAQFQRLAESRALQHDLVLALREEKDRGIKLGLQQEMDEYLRLQRRHLEGSATVLQTRLVVGLDRRAFAAADAVLKLTVGTTLIVLATAEERGDRQLWWQNVQQALLHERGCTAGNPRRRRPAIQATPRDASGIAERRRGDIRGPPAWNKRATVFADVGPGARAV